MPGSYLLALLVSTAGIIALDARFRLALWRQPKVTAVAVLLGVGFFLVWDLVAIRFGIFLKGESPLLLGIDLAPELPVEEPIFLAFLCYLAAVCWGAAAKWVGAIDSRRQ